MLLYFNVLLVFLRHLSLLYVHMGPISWRTGLNFH